MELSTTDRCGSCGLPVEDDRPQCQRVFDELLAQHFSNPAFAGIHRLFVDTYCLQHPENGCISFKSFAAHSVHVCWSLEHGGSHAAVNEQITRWVQHHADSEKPPLPVHRGTLTIADVIRAEDPQQRKAAVERWARDVWSGYADLHPTVRHWTDIALGIEMPANSTEPTQARRTR